MNLNTYFDPTAIFEVNRQRNYPELVPSNRTATAIPISPPEVDVVTFYGTPKPGPRTKNVKAKRPMPYIPKDAKIRDIKTRPREKKLQVLSYLYNHKVEIKEGGFEWRSSTIREVSKKFAIPPPQYMIGPRINQG